MTVYLVGGSMRLTPGFYTHTALLEAGIVSLSENCRPSHGILEHIGRWIEGATTRDIIYINCGLHDIRHNQDRNGPVTDIETYRSNLIQVLDYPEQTRAKIIWVSNTPFLESVHDIVKPSHRYLANLKAYNRMTEGLARQYGFAVDDLYSLIFKQGLTNVMLCDELHFNEFGSETIDKTVAKAILKRIGQLDVIHFYHVFNIETDFRL